MGAWHKSVVAQLSPMMHISVQRPMLHNAAYVSRLQVGAVQDHVTHATRQRCCADACALHHTATGVAAVGVLTHSGW